MKNLRDTRKAKNLTLYDVANKVGVSKSTIARWETGEVSSIPHTYLKRLADALDVDVTALLPENNGTLKSSAKLPSNTVPVYDGVACGTPVFADENLVGTLPIYGTEADFRLVCHGDSMLPKLAEGDRVIVRKQSAVDNGEIAVVLIENERTLKRVYQYPDRIVLAPENPIYSPIVIDKSRFDDVLILGKAVSVYHDL